MRKNHFLPFQISTTIFIFVILFTKWPPAPILDVRNSLLIAFLAISDRYASLNFFEMFDKMAAVGHFGCPKFTLDRISGHFRSIRNLIWFLIFFYKMVVVGQFGCPKFTFNRISGHFRLIRIFFLILQNGRRRFWLHFWPFQIDRPCLKLTFDGNFGHFRSMQNLFFRRPFWMSENHFRLHFWSIRILIIL